MRLLNNAHPPDENKMIRLRLYVQVRAAHAGRVQVVIRGELGRDVSACGVGVVGDAQAGDRERRRSVVARRAAEADLAALYEEKEDRRENSRRYSRELGDRSFN